MNKALKHYLREKESQTSQSSCSSLNPSLAMVNYLRKDESHLANHLNFQLKIHKIQNCDFKQKNEWFIMRFARPRMKWSPCVLCLFSSRTWIQVILLKNDLNSICIMYQSIDYSILPTKVMSKGIILGFRRGSSQF